MVKKCLRKNKYIVTSVIGVFLLSLLVIELFINKNEAEDYVETNNQETNISILTLGDSITWLDDNKVSGVESIIGYQQVLRETSATVFSYGVYGGTYSQKPNSSGKIKSIYQEIVINKTVNFSNLDTIILFGGTNDIGMNMPLGSIDSQDSYTTLGAINLIIDYL